MAKERMVYGIGNSQGTKGRTMSSLKVRPILFGRVISIDGSPVTRALFNNVRWAWVWIILRIYVGGYWFLRGWNKLHNPAWSGPNAGAMISKLIDIALDKAVLINPDAQSWYAWMLKHVFQPYPIYWSNYVSWSELLVGMSLLLGIFTGFAAFVSCLLIINALLVGVISSNPLLFVFSVSLILAWKTAGWYGVDRWLLLSLKPPLRPKYNSIEEGSQ